MRRLWDVAARDLPKGENGTGADPAKEKPFGTSRETQIVRGNDDSESVTGAGHVLGLPD